MVVDGNKQYSLDPSDIKNTFLDWWGVQCTEVHGRVECGPAPWFNDMVQITQELNDQLVQPITREEVLDMLSHMANTTPRTDQISAGVLKLVPGAHVDILVALFNQYLQGKELPSDWKEVAITLLFKDRDQAEPGNYRPIALLQVAYKLYMSVLTQ
jgi:hypothetical protein